MLETKILKCVIILSLYHITASDFFHHGADDCINKLNSYFDQMKGGARVQLDKNKGEKQLPIREIVPDLANTS